MSPALAGRFSTTAPPGKPPGFTLEWLISNIRLGIRALEKKSRDTPVVSYLSYPGLSKRDFQGSGQPDFLPSRFASSCVIQLAICLFRVGVFAMDTSAMKPAMSGTSPAAS